MKRKCARTAMTIAAMAIALLETATQTVAQPKNAKLAKTIPKEPVPVNLRDWVTNDDYPDKALRENASGVVRFVLTISDKGVPTACEVVGSSQSADLDSTTCVLLMQRAQFTPAIGPNGIPTTGTYRSSMRWVMPDVPDDMPVAGKSSVTFDVLPDGTTKNCVESAAGQILVTWPNKNLQSPCSNPRQSYKVPGNPSGNVTKKHIVIETTITITDVP